MIKTHKRARVSSAEALVVLLPQRGHHHSQELAESCVDFRSEGFTQLTGNNHGDAVIIQVLHTIFQTVEDDFSMSGHFGICCYGVSIVEVSKTTKVSLSPGVDNQTFYARKVEPKKFLYLLHLCIKPTETCFFPCQF
uniref:Uncharacterized protein n=1 Tax=Nothobranchius furzeri TaxID=105023 RepID=A0A8C6L592_NOTFU